MSGGVASFAPSGDWDAALAAADAALFRAKEAGRNLIAVDPLSLQGPGSRAIAVA